MSDAKLQALRKLKGNFPLYAQHVLRIVDKDGKLSPFRLNRGQYLAHRIIEKQKREKGYVRALAIKARQVGISTYSEGRYYWKVTGTPNSNAFVLSHLADATANLFNMVKTFYENVPDPIFAPPTEGGVTTGMRFSELNSSYRIGTARSIEVGRSGTNRFVHGSEVAFYPHQREIVAGLLQTVPPLGSEVIMESTANGVGDWFYEQVMKSLRGETDWTVIFVPWFWMPEYWVKPSPYFEPTDEEQRLMDQFKLDAGQIMFRRMKIDEFGDPDLFCQEYPSTPHEAFLFSGRTFIQGSDIDREMLETFTPRVVGNIDRTGQFMSTRKGPYREWEKPKREGSYTIGVDVSEGLAHGDYTVAQVLDERGVQVARWKGHIDPYDFAEILYHLGHRFSRAYLIIERNNHGLTLIRRIQELGYPNLFIDHMVDRAYADKSTKRVGFLTTTKTKPLILDNLRALIRQGESGIRDKETLEECRTLVVDDVGRINAQTGHHDDCVMSYALALHGLNTMPRKKFHPVRRERWQAPTEAGY